MRGESASETDLHPGRMARTTNPMLTPEWLAMIHAMFARYQSGDIPDHDTMIAALKENTARAMREVPAERLLVWQASDGWEPICEALGVPVPAEPFPRTNTSEEWRAREAAMAAGKSPGAPH